MHIWKSRDWIGLTGHFEHFGMLFASLIVTVHPIIFPDQLRARSVSNKADFYFLSLQAQKDLYPMISLTSRKVFEALSRAFSAPMRTTLFR